MNETFTTGPMPDHLVNCPTCFEAVDPRIIINWVKKSVITDEVLSEKKQCMSCHRNDCGIIVR